MKVLIVSDTHRRNENYFKVLKYHPDADAIIHCGDIEGSEYALEQAAPCPVYMVTGNNDFFSELPR
ncbi:MAG: metallophosphoesterase family protein, partial [Lachnospiraceae bacterium]|nr:metallophosphoesterase family protein [Lachnospiraceae bacterium]